MCLLCPRVSILLLLPLMALSCTSTKPLQDIEVDYRAKIRTDLLAANKRVVNLLLNRTCPGLKAHLKATLSCTPNQTSLVPPLLRITCRMKDLSVAHTKELTDSVQLSVNCPCPQEEAKRRRRVPRNERHRHKKHMKKLCRAKILLSSLDECYQLLNHRRSAGQGINMQ